MKYIKLLVLSLILFSCGQQNESKESIDKIVSEKKTVTPENFIRAETDNAFVQMINNAGKSNEFFHYRTPTPLDKQTVIRMNRDVLYSGGVFDAREGINITFPEIPDDRYASIYIIDNDHYVQEIIYEPGQYTMNGNTDFLYIIIRLQVYNADDENEIKMLNDLQNKFVVESVSAKDFPEFKWDKESLDSLRTVYNEESANYASWEGMMGKRGEVNENTRHIAAAAAWGLLPEEAATYLNYTPEDASASNCFSATYEVPSNTGFWSITVYGEDGYIKSENCLLNGSNVKLNNDGTFTVHYGSEENCGDVKNRLDAPEGWNFLLRVYLPGEEVLKGDYEIPEVQ
ncbi:DUF1214 domain-containing protein [Marinigracilibium pacificum]|uniref:DUF1214 domain-containing protein n=1 Tax=Marinigracilibium pacificum TaxID=2729599 RepID=A0A848IVC5_9BACT|nr:DUF1214 domain-containing protein [Marinigracilibium pacificum]NMM48287.1 DUF1214 domain-containing protein [Marinigracilibium pacificum]